ncbi:hypothetical protein LTR78_008866 [Recurvomyces mirabilis]|uniref:Uncharacterized protein n=1 Tax=Recurvomyces mirabilis TaxID=574656 RepID=A0AAE0WIN0_9PEZI|nr:hypothetical protein LTR78_008866 [Recurvomyces mirabilis]KAK5155781.1 hypothetical protein LTS14_005347 [Recurvomyces mirabilis]
MKDDEEGQAFLGSPSSNWQQSSRSVTEQSFAIATHYVDNVKDVYSRSRLNRYNVTRRQLLITLGCLFFGIILLTAFGRSGSVTGLVASSAAAGICSNARENPHSIKAPSRPNVARLTAVWPGVKHALEIGGKDLPSLDKPDYAFHPDGGPTIEDYRARTDDLSAEDALKIRQIHAKYIKAIPKYPKKTYKGRGIVMLAGGHYSEFAATSLGVLREIGSILPVEVWRRDEREEKHDGWCQEIENEGMACRRLSDYLDTDLIDIKGGYEMKVLCMLFSSFEEIVFIDADNMALQRPELLFDSQAYKDTGVVLWHDYWNYDNIDWLDYVIGVSDEKNENLWEHTTHESGEIVWNKKRNWDALMLAVYYNYFGPKLYYTLLNFNYAGWGDKDTFALAFRALKKPFHTVLAPPGDAWERGKVNTRRVGMLQMAPGSDPPVAAFLHVTTVKWSHRDFVCDGCLPIWHTESPGDPFISGWEDSNSELYPFLHSNLSIIEPEGLDKYMPTTPGTDVPLQLEAMLWRATEYAACRSPAWRHERTCAVARRYMMGTWGFTFAMKEKPGKNTTEMNGGLAWLPSMEAKTCLIDPPDL